MLEHFLEQIVSPEPEIRAAAFEGLREIDPSSISHAEFQQIGNSLREFIVSSAYSDPERQIAATVLGVLGNEPILLELLKSETPSVRGQAAVGLGECATESACKVLTQLLKDSVNTVRNLAERSLIKQIELVKSHCIEDLLVLLSHPEPLTHSPAARLLGLTQSPDALALLLKMATEGEKWLTRVWSVKALGDLGQQEAFETLSRILVDDEKNRVRAAAATAIAELRHAKSRELLESIDSETDEGVKTAIEEALELLQQSGQAEAADPYADS
ncbi:MAG TPA: HEAT repeat domain-containing protein [Planctomycetaceae bacterium]|nr:HEAT repeat domain-containing protein [Planctomycetaceae bacterium]